MQNYHAESSAQTDGDIVESEKHDNRVFETLNSTQQPVKMRALNASTSIHLVELAQKCLHEVPVPDRSGSIWQHSTSPSDKQRRTETSKLCSDPLDFRAQTSRRAPGRNSVVARHIEPRKQGDPSALTDDTTATSENHPHPSLGLPELHLHTMAPMRSTQTCEPEILRRAHPSTNERCTHSDHRRTSAR